MRAKRQLTGWGNSYTFDRNLISKIYKEINKILTPGKPNQSRKEEEDWSPLKYRQRRRIQKFPIAVTKHCRGRPSPSTPHRTKGQRWWGCRGEQGCCDVAWRGSYGRMGGNFRNRTALWLSPIILGPPRIEATDSKQICAHWGTVHNSQTMEPVWLPINK